jgi:hypothetical protein
MHIPQICIITKGNSKKSTVPGISQYKVQLSVADTSSFESSRKEGVVEKSSSSSALLFARATTASGKLANSAT